MIADDCTSAAAAARKGLTAAMEAVASHSCTPSVVATYGQAMKERETGARPGVIMGAHDAGATASCGSERAVMPRHRMTVVASRGAGTPPSVMANSVLAEAKRICSENGVVSRGWSTMESREAAAWRRGSGRQPVVGKGGAAGSKVNFQRLNQWVWVCSCSALVSYASATKQAKREGRKRIRRYDGCTSREHCFPHRFDKGRFERGQALWRRQVACGNKVVICRPESRVVDQFQLEMEEVEEKLSEE